MSEWGGNPAPFGKEHPLAATATSSLIGTNKGRSRDEIMEKLEAQKKALLNDPGMMIPPADLSHIESRYLFRTRAGTVRMLTCWLDAFPDLFTNDLDGRKAAAWKKIYNRRYDQKKQADIVELTRRANGPQIIFSRVPLKHECYYATDDEVLAAFIRAKMIEGNGPWQHVYEEQPTAVLIVGQEVFPATEQGTLAANQYAAEHGIDTIRRDSIPRGSKSTPTAAPAGE